jgi:hypothetical protein
MLDHSESQIERGPSSHDEFRLAHVAILGLVHVPSWMRCIFAAVWWLNLECDDGKCLVGAAVTSPLPPERMRRKNIQQVCPHWFCFISQ